jgi:hypothetical protein
MLKKIIAMTIALVIIASFTMTVFAGYDESSGGASAPTSAAAAAARSGSVSKEAASADKGKSKKSTYDDFDMTGPDAEFYESIKKVLEEGKPVNNDLKIVEITKPDKAEISIYDKKFGISVITEYDDVVFSVAKLNAVTGKYERIAFDGEKSIKLACGTGSAEVILGYGTNNLLIISYRNSDKQASKVQYNAVVVKVSKETADDKAAAPEKAVKKAGSEPLDLQTFIDNLFGKGK